MQKMWNLSGFCWGKAAFVINFTLNQITKLFPKNGVEWVSNERRCENGQLETKFNDLLARLFTTAAGMSLVIPFLSFYIEELGVTGTSSIAQWSGLAFGVTFLMGAIVSPIWGKLGDIHGRKLMLIRASLGMAIIINFDGVCNRCVSISRTSIFNGIGIFGFLSTAMTFIAAETPKDIQVGQFPQFQPEA